MMADDKEEMPEAESNWHLTNSAKFVEYKPTVQEQQQLHLHPSRSWASHASDLRSRIRAAYLPLIALLQEAEDIGFNVICSVSRDPTNRLRQTDDDIKIFRHF